MEKFTKETLAKFDGKDDNKAYVAIDGDVYDVTGNSYWTNGQHFGGAVAGRDMTALIAQSPHGKSVLSKLEKVGTYEG